METQISKSHQTALFIAPGTHKERTNRLLESLNGKNIKVDVYRPVTTTTSVVARVNDAGVGGSPSVPAAEFDLDLAVKAAREAGYNQILVSVPA